MPILRRAVGFEAVEAAYALGLDWERPDDRYDDHAWDDGYDIADQAAHALDAHGFHIEAYAVNPNRELVDALWDDNVGPTDEELAAIEAELRGA